MSRKVYCSFLILIYLWVLNLNAQSYISPPERVVLIESEGITLSGSLFYPDSAIAAVVIVHGSGQEERMSDFAKLLAANGIAVLTYDKRGVGKSGGIYAGPEVRTNNIDRTNLNLLAQDASAAINVLNAKVQDLPIGLLGFSQAGWIIPLAAHQNPLVKFMVMFSCPTINTLEQLRFQFYTNGEVDFWDTHSEEEARYHLINDPDRYEFESTDPKNTLSDLDIPGIWLFGEKDIQIPVKVCIEQLNVFKADGKPFEYCLFPNLGHNTAHTDSAEPVDIAVQWIKSAAKSK